MGGASATEQSPGIAWSERYSYCVNWESDDRPPATPNVYKDYSCVISIGEILEIWAVEVFVYFVFAIYLDNILKNENGLRRPPWYFFMPGAPPPPLSQPGNTWLHRPIVLQPSTLAISTLCGRSWHMLCTVKGG